MRGAGRQSASEAVSLPAHKADHVVFNLELPVGSYCTWIASQAPCAGFLAPTCLQLAHFTLAAVSGAHGAQRHFRTSLFLFQARFPHRASRGSCLSLSSQLRCPSRGSLLAHPTKKSFSQCHEETHYLTIFAFA